MFYIMPAIRRELTIAMKDLGFTQKKIAKLLGVTEPAVSQYVNSKRAVNVDFNEHIKDHIKESAKKISDQMSLIEEMQFLMRLASNDKLKCKVCHDITGTDSSCNICYEEKLDEVHEHGKEAKVSKT